MFPESITRNPQTTVCVVPGLPHANTQLTVHNAQGKEFVNGLNELLGKRGPVHSDKFAAWQQVNVDKHNPIFDLSGPESWIQ